MKKQIFLAIIVSIITLLSSCGQETKLGIKAGVNLSTTTNSIYMYVNKSKVRYHGGAIARIKISKSLAFQPELLYSLAGDEAIIYDIHPDFVNGRLKTHLHYLALPVAMKFYPYKGLIVQFGFQQAFLVQAKEKGSVGRRTNSRPRNQDVTRYYNPFDAALLLGLGLDFKSGFTIDSRLLYGIADTYKPDAGLDIIRDRIYQSLGEKPQTVRNIVLQLSLGYIFNK